MLSADSGGGCFSARTASSGFAGDGDVFESTFDASDASGSAIVEVLEVAVSTLGDRRHANFSVGPCPLMSGT